MTENEAIRDLDIIRFNPHWDELVNAEYWEELMTMAIKALEEVQRYRAIGTVEDIADGIKQSEEEFNMLMEYLNIGTIEEFKDLKEKSEPKEMDRYYCPICRHYFEDGEAHNYCPVCGQKLDWQ